MKETYVWNVALIVSMIIFIIFILLHTGSVNRCLVEEIPDNSWRIITIGMIISAISFLVIGLLLHTFKPITKN